MDGNNEKIALAYALAAYAHRDQKDKAGRPYIEHPVKVSEGVTGEDEKIVALLHDVLEDTFVQETTIRNLFGDEIADAVLAMTRVPGENYMDFIRRCRENPLAWTVKLADLAHNMYLSRLENVSEKDLKRLEKYRKARALLLE